MLATIGQSSQKMKRMSKISSSERNWVAHTRQSVMCRERRLRPQAFVVKRSRVRVIHAGRLNECIRFIWIWSRHPEAAALSVQSVEFESKRSSQKGPFAALRCQGASGGRGAGGVRLQDEAMDRKELWSRRHLRAPLVQRRRDGSGGKR